MAERTAQTMTTSLSCFWRMVAFAEDVDAWVDMVWWMNVTFQAGFIREISPNHMHHRFIGLQHK